MNSKFLHFIFWILILSSHDLRAQESKNLIPNPSFEAYLEKPMTWFYKGADFDKILQFWHSPTPASPDVYSPDISPPKDWRLMGFGEQEPKDGHSMVGLTLYGCKDGKPHCREYIQVLLNEPMVVGQNYCISFWVSHLQRSISTNNIGLYFSDEPLDEIFDTRIDLKPHLNFIEIISCPNKSWQKVELSFTATESGSYLTIGNFYDDEVTKISIGDNSLKYAYYYFDDFSLIKKPPILPIPVAEDNLGTVILEEGKTFALKNIFFDLDRSNFIPRSYIQLNTLYKIMHDNPNMEIEIHGHTDNLGSTAYNMTLSNERALAVLNYLAEKGINADRLSYKGYGSLRPIASNDSNKGRKQNRRVEFKVIKK